jgi:hypothetical protein
VPQAHGHLVQVQEPHPLRRNPAAG